VSLTDRALIPRRKAQSLTTTQVHADTSRSDAHRDDFLGLDATSRREGVHNGLKSDTRGRLAEREFAGLFRKPEQSGRRFSTHRVRKRARCSKLQCPRGHAKST
jgi:hypothetical protein